VRLLLLLLLLVLLLSEHLIEKLKLCRGER